MVNRRKVMSLTASLALACSLAHGLSEECPAGTVEMRREVVGNKLKIYCKRIRKTPAKDIRALPHEGPDQAIDKEKEKAASGVSPQGASLKPIVTNLVPPHNRADVPDAQGQGDKGWEKFEAELRVEGGVPPAKHKPILPATAALMALAAGAWAWMNRNRRMIAGVLMAIGLMGLVVVLLRSPPPPMVALASRMGLAEWLAGPGGVVTAEWRILRLSDHATVRMSLWQVSVPQLRNVVQRQSFPYFHEGVWKRGYYDAGTRVFVGTYNGVITTVIGDVKSQYISNLTSRVP